MLCYLGCCVLDLHCLLSYLNHLLEKILRPQNPRMSVTRNDNVHEQTASELDRINFYTTAHCVCLSYARLGRILGQANAPN